jgi:hypothetical protein
MNCTQCNELLFDYIEGLMDDQDKHALEAHIETCAECKEALKDMQALQSRLTEHGQNTAQTELETHVLGAIVRGQKKQLQTVTPQSPHLRRTIMKNPIFKLSLAAAVVIACTLGFTLLTSTQNIALADVLTRIEQVQAYLYRMNMTITHSGDLPPGFPETQDITATAMMSQEYGTKLTMDMGIFDEYTMLNYLDIEALGPVAGKPGDLNGDCLVDLEDSLTALYVLAGKDISVDLSTDINGDESIGLAEAVFALRQAAGN